jgi:hypothetical protein
LPVDDYVFAEWRARRVGVDYRVDVDGHYSPSLTVRRCPRNAHATATATKKRNQCDAESCTAPGT